MLHLQRYRFSSGFYRTFYQIRYNDSRGYSRLRNVYTYSTAPAYQYTLSSLRFGEVYNVSVRVRVRVISSCYSTYFYGDYSDAITVETVETGMKLI